MVWCTELRADRHIHEEDGGQGGNGIIGILVNMDVMSQKKIFSLKKIVTYHIQLKFDTVCFLSKLIYFLCSQQNFNE